MKDEGEDDDSDNDRCVNDNGGCDEKCDDNGDTTNDGGLCW